MRRIYPAQSSSMNVLTWNLFHGRSMPPAKRDLLDRFALLLGGWEWDVAMLQEAPPWWPAQLAVAADADFRAALTSRNAGLWLRREVGERWPDLIKSNAGGCNAILVRRAGAGVIVEDERVRLRLWPERRIGQLVRLAGGVCLANVHASARVPLAANELERLWDRALAFADGAPLILGGDLNLRSPRAPQIRNPSIAHVASRDVDHIFARGLAPVRSAQKLERWASASGCRVQLSDHVPLLVELEAMHAPSTSGS
ncbi:MAG: endonuclease/exonuclease/phosphatase family protein [Solirubrobacteraceae bacterium]